MKNIADPQQNWLFDTSLSRFSAVAQRRLIEDWPGVFRMCILQLMPAKEIGRHFSEETGRPTKELYSASGLLLLMEMNDWTVAEAADAYMFDSRVQFALNIGLDQQSMSTRTVERYQQLCRQDGLAHEVMTRVTTRLIELLDVKVDQLRLDSTHIFSNMASFGRTRLMATVIRRFLIQVERHNPESFAALDEELRKRYAKKHWDFGKGKAGLSAEEAAADMYCLIATFQGDESVNNRTTFKDLRRVFSEQCELREKKVVIRKKTGGATLQNPSDPDATYDAHKGSGYQAQTAETCSDDNDTQLIISILPETACAHDQNAVEKVLDDLKSRDIEPTCLLADAGYGGDPNFCLCKDRDVDLVAPVVQGNLKEGRIEMDQFELAEDSSIIACPVGAVPESSWFNSENDRGAAVFAAEHCDNCPLKEHCLAQRKGKNYHINYAGGAVRTSQRKRQMQTLETRELYAKRSGVESIYSTGKRSMGLGRLRVRGKPAVFFAITMKFTGLNIHRAAASAKIRQLVKETLASAFEIHVLATDFVLSGLLAAIPAPLRRIRLV
jgi:hypothetical protein